MSGAAMKNFRALLVSPMVAAGLLGCVDQGGEFPDEVASSQREVTARPADSQVVRDWNQQVITTVRAKPSLLYADIARCFAMVNVAMYDAVNGIERRRTSALVAPRLLARGSREAAAAQTAHDVLVGLFPDQAAAYDTQLTAHLAA